MTMDKDVNMKVILAVHIADFHMFTVIYSSLHGFIWNQQSDHLPLGLLAHSAEHCTGIGNLKWNFVDVHDLWFELCICVYFCVFFKQILL